MRHFFPKVVSYNHFVELEKEIAIPLALFIKKVLLGKCSMGWFFGFKPHLIVNDKGEILNFMFTPGNVDDREPLKQGKFLENIKGKLCADKGYIGQALFENLFLNGIQLVTKV